MMDAPSNVSVIRKAVVLVRPWSTLFLFVERMPCGGSGTEDFFFEEQDSSRRRRGSFVVTCQPRLRPDLLNVCYRDDTRGMEVPMIVS